MTLANAVDAALKLKAALTTEIARSKEVRTVLKDMRSSQLLTQASLRDAFNQHSVWLSAQLTQAIADYANSLGQTDVTLEQIRAHSPFEGAQLTDLFAELRALSASLAELDAFNQHLAERALTFVTAYVNHLAPRPTAYNRRGHLSQFDAATHSEHI